MNATQLFNKIKTHPAWQSIWLDNQFKRSAVAMVILALLACLVFQSDKAAGIAYETIVIALGVWWAGHERDCPETRQKWAIISMWWILVHPMFMLTGAPMLYKTEYMWAWTLMIPALIYFGLASFKGWIK